MFHIVCNSNCEKVMSDGWHVKALCFLESMEDLITGGTPSVPGGPVTLYGTCYAALGKFYLGSNEAMSERTKHFILGYQDEESGLMVGPELRDFKSAKGVMHDSEHLLLHLTCAAVPTCQHFGIPLKYPIFAAHQFCDLDYLKNWMGRRDLRAAWFEGNNILFVGQFLIYLRDVERYPGAQAALDVWFDWLDTHMDPQNGLWGTNGFCSPKEAVYGGYHQLLAYYSENHPMGNPSGLVDTVLELQHVDGGFNPNGNGGACEDVDCVDILVNLYKRQDYRRAEIRYAMRRCLHHILDTQNPDGGFPYNQNQAQSHMGIPGTEASPNQSTTFATWFRVHTLALMAEILLDQPELQFPFRFTNTLSMGWHRPWNKSEHPLTVWDRIQEKPFERRWQRKYFWHSIRAIAPTPVRKTFSRAKIFFHINKVLL